MKPRSDSVSHGGFRASQPHSENLESSEIDDLISSISDIALILDADGTILDASIASADLQDLTEDGLLGKSWFDTVTSESREKLADLLAEPDGTAPSSWRQVTHRNVRGEEVPIRYSTIRLNGNGQFLAIGKNMRAVAALQQDLVESQLAMEREYARLRAAETRYRLLFQVSSEPVLVVDSGRHTILEANASVGNLLRADVKRLEGSSVFGLFDTESRARLENLFAELASGKPSVSVETNTADGSERIAVTGSLFRHEGKLFHLLRLSTQSAAQLGGETEAGNLLGRIIESSHDAFVVTDPKGDILKVNPAFLEMAQVGQPEQVLGRNINNWLGRSSVDFNVIMANLREHGSVRMFSTVIRNQFGMSLDVELSAVSATDSDPPCIGFVIRTDSGRDLVSSIKSTVLPSSTENLSNLVGRVPLKDIVQETTDIIERLCIESALELTGNNRASAAELLGLSRQSLYVKLRRFGIDERS